MYIQFIRLLVPVLGCLLRISCIPEVHDRCVGYEGGRATDQLCRPPSEILSPATGIGAKVVSDSRFPSKDSLGERCGKLARRLQCTDDCDEPLTAYDGVLRPNGNLKWVGEMDSGLTLETEISLSSSVLRVLDGGIDVEFSCGLPSAIKLHLKTRGGGWRFRIYALDCGGVASCVEAQLSPSGDMNSKVTIGVDLEFFEFEESVFSDIKLEIVSDTVPLLVIEKLVVSAWVYCHLHSNIVYHAGDYSSCACFHNTGGVECQNCLERSQEKHVALPISIDVNQYYSINGVNMSCNVITRQKRDDESVDRQYINNATSCTSSLCYAGYCYDDDQGVYCECISGFFGVTCDVTKDRCQGNPCKSEVWDNCTSTHICVDLISEFICLTNHSCHTHEVVNTDTALLIGIIVASVSVVVICIVWAIFYVMCKHNESEAQKAKSAKFKHNVTNMLNNIATVEILSKKTAISAKQAILRDRWMLPEDSVTLGTLIAAGEYCNIYNGYWDKSGKGTDIKKIALKSTISQVDETSQHDFNNEIDTLTSLYPHISIISIHGLWNHREIYHIALEYQGIGDLREFLHCSREENDDDLKPAMAASFAADISRGLAYMHKKRFINRDIACRNVLITAEKRAKICDLGMSRRLDKELQEIYADHHCKLEYHRWLAPECLTDGFYSFKTDVWSFGIVLWEILTLGGLPYPKMTVTMVTGLLGRSYTMDTPHHCSGEWNNMICRCWSRNPHQRPFMKDVAKDLKRLSRIQLGWPDYMDYKPEEYVNIKSASDEDDANSCV